MDDLLIDSLKQAFGYTTDAQIAEFLSVDRQTIYNVRSGIAKLGERQRFKILDRVLYHKTENLALRCLPKSLVEKIQQIRKDQHEAWVFPVMEVGSPATDDALLLDTYKEFRGLRTDQEMAEILRIKRNAISMVRSGRNRLGPLPRLRIFRDVWGESIDHIEEAINSSEALLKLIREFDSTNSCSSGATSECSPSSSPSTEVIDSQSSM